MPKVKWDEAGTRVYETGVSQCVLYPTDDTGAYTTGVAWNGITQISNGTDGGDTNDFWADNMKYISLRGAENFKPSITAYTYPDEWAECDGSASPVAGVYIGQQTRRVFGLSYRTEVGNDLLKEAYGYKIHLVWGATAAPSDKEYDSINDSPEAIEFSWELDTTPVPVTGYKATAHMEIDTTKIPASKQTKIAELEAIIYGVDADQEHSIEGSDPRLPTPDEVIALFTAA